MKNDKTIKSRLVQEFKHMFSVFKQHYKYFHTLFHPHVVPKNINNITKTILPNEPLIFLTVFLYFS